MVGGAVVGWAAWRVAGWVGRWRGVGNWRNGAADEKRRKKIRREAGSYAANQIAVSRVILSIPTCVQHERREERR